MERFEVKETYVSNAFLTKDLGDVYRILNLSVHVKMGGEYDKELKLSPNHEELAEEFGKVMKEAFLKRCKGDLEASKKVRITALNPHPVTEISPESSQFGWFELKEQNEN
jgi:hypothetical protein